jgi:hypothetical protein
LLSDLITVSILVGAIVDSSQETIFKFFVCRGSIIIRISSSRLARKSSAGVQVRGLEHELSNDSDLEDGGLVADAPGEEPDGKRSVEGMVFVF